MPTVQLRLQQVSLSTAVGSHQLLKDISFEVFAGERIAIVGPSGAGKTSLLRLLNRLSEPTDGSIYLENQEYRQIPILQLRQQVTLVLQESKLLGMTVQEAIAYPLVLRRLPPQEIQQRLSYWTEQLSIPSDWLMQTEWQLSVGQRQLVAIARALVIQPKILLFDEPTSALDFGRASRLLQVLTQLTESNRTTILMVNHQLELAQQFCQRVLYFQHGHLVQDVPNSEQLDWAKLRATLSAAEAQAAEEWS
ncbi:MAG: ATP-binding cassette domain-containing protein [Chroococcidiopsidaceae cyanobacterium CP_BM_RX_35]|nr:ATP-binding cassette domain-containing protein [Chroococcidiopsidaceae cyanobacterium CP_BM_RX_35]